MTAVFLQFAYLAAMGFCGCTSGWLFFRADRNRTTKALILCQALIVIWCAPQLFLSFPMTREMKYFLYGISYIGISLIGPSWLMFSLLYCGRKAGRGICLGLYGVAAFDYAMFLTNGLHHLFYRRFELAEVIYGPLFYFHMVYTYGCVLGGMGAVLSGFRKKQVPAVHTAVILLAAAVPLSFNLLYLSGTVEAGFDLTPPMFALSSFLMLMAVFRYDFLDVDVAASRQIFSSIAEGIVICNRRGRVTYCNETASRWLQVKNGEESGKMMERFQKEDPESNQVVFQIPDGKTLRLKRYDLEGRTGTRVLVATDISEYCERLRQSRELAVSQQKLAMEQERNRIAQEVHDTTGHTLTMLNSLIKLIRFSCTEEKLKGAAADPQLEEYLSQAQELASGGIRELRWSINHLRQGTEGELVTQGVFQLASSVRETEVEVEIQGEDGPQYSHLSSTVYQCLREAITNSLRYASASHMDVIVKFEKEAVSLYVFDNGRGCSSIEESHGLRGIRERVDKAGGQARFLSSEGEGFQIFIRLPVKQNMSGAAAADT